MTDCDKYKALLMGLIDGELTPEEAGEVDAHLIKCNACREEYEQLRVTAAKIETVSLDEPQDEVLKRLWKSPYSRFTRNSGLFFVLAGWLSLIIYGLIEAFRSSEDPLFPKIAMAAMIIGFIVLLLLVIRERMVTYKTDPYKEVRR
jgi:anti-sigma factor RsiW